MSQIQEAMQCPLHSAHVKTKHIHATYLNRIIQRPGDGRPSTGTLFGGVQALRCLRLRQQSRPECTRYRDNAQEHRRPAERASGRVARRRARTACTTRYLYGSVSGATKKPHQNTQKPPKNTPRNETLLTHDVCQPTTTWLPASARHCTNLGAKYAFSSSFTKAHTRATTLNELKRLFAGISKDVKPPFSYRTPS